MRYQAIIDPSNKNNSHSLTIDFIAQATIGDSLEILDVGCSAGYLGEYLRNQGHHVTGIDITQEAIVKAAEFLNEVHCMKVEEFFASHPLRRFDVVIFGDVLEHVTNAEEVLKLTLEALKPCGRVVASIPNVSHLAVRAMLLEGRWEYADLGLLDRDHVRFFTKKTIQKLFNESGFEIVDMGETKLPVEIVDKLCNMQLNPIFVEAAKKTVGDDSASTVFQYITVAQSKSSAPRIVCLLPGVDNSLFDIRIKTPIVNWAKRHGGFVRFRVLGEHTPEDLSWGDAFLFQRQAGTHTLQLMKKLQSFNKKVIFDIDDLLTQLPAFLSHHQLSPEIHQSLLDVIAQADVVTTTTNRLAAELHKLNPNVVCVPNSVMYQPPDRISENPNSIPKATLIIASSDAVLVDFLIEPLRMIQQQHGNFIKIVIVGPIGREFKKCGLIFEGVPIIKYKDFTDFLRTLLNPIGLIPLDNSLFSMCKSPIKFLDYSAAQIPSICSDTAPYSDCIVNNSTGILVKNNTDEWVNAINFLISSGEARLRISSAAHQLAMDKYLADYAGDAWQKVIDLANVKQLQNTGKIDYNPLCYNQKLSYKYMLTKALDRRAYRKIIIILKMEGLSGLKKFLSNYK